MPYLVELKFGWDMPTITVGDENYQISEIINYFEDRYALDLNLYGPNSPLEGVRNIPFILVDELE